MPIRSHSLVRVSQSPGPVMPSTVNVERQVRRPPIVPRGPTSLDACRSCQGLGQVSPPLVKAIIERIIRITAEVADPAELAIYEWSDVLGRLMEARVITCEQVRRYNAAARRLYKNHLAAFVAMKRTGVEGLTPPVHPPVFGVSAKVGVKFGSLEIDDGCKSSSFHPDFNAGFQRFVFNAPLPSTINADLGIAMLAPVAAPWIGRVVVAVVVSIGVILVLNELRKLFSSERWGEITNEYARISQSTATDRVKAYEACVTAGGDPKECSREARRLVPQPKAPSQPPTLLQQATKLVVVGGLVGGGLFVAKRLSE